MMVVPPNLMKTFLTHAISDESEKKGLEARIFHAIGCTSDHGALPTDS